MNWKALKDNKCPKCGSDIFRRQIDDYGCIRCGFYCKLEKARKIIDDVERAERDKSADEFLKEHNCYISKI